MLFNSSAFIAFYITFFPLYWLLNKHITARNVLVLLGSYYFYGSWDWRFLSLIIISTLVDYYCGKKIYENDDKVIKRRYLIISLIVNLGILGIFKYLGFFVNSFIDLLYVFGIQANVNTLNIILPVGISFYTFQTLSYSIDIYRDKMKPSYNLLAFAAFVSYFPQLVAGPIERANRLLPQIEKVAMFSFVQFREGCFLILWGLIKKTLIADRLAPYVDLVFEDPSSFTGTQCLIAVMFFAVQIYCDFSGYSDIARGLAKTMGIELMINFNVPYYSSSIKEFWQRWHISLSTWFRDYVYIPLGGSRASKFLANRNIIITFVVSGLWHGAAYTFVIWGALHALGYLVDPHSYLNNKVNKKFNVLFKLTGLIWTLLFVNVAWVFFRASNLEDAFFIITKIANSIPILLTQNHIHSINDIVVGMSNTEFLLGLYFIVLLMISDWFFRDRGIESITTSMSLPVRWVYSWFLLGNLLLLSTTDTGAFIYFQF